MLTQDQIHELYEYSLKSKTHIITYIDGKVKRILNISIDNITGLLHNKVLISEQHFISSKMHFIGRANLSKRSRKDLKRAMPHLSVSMSKPFQKWHKMVSTKRQV
jgi:hypothetical protein